MGNFFFRLLAIIALLFSLFVISESFSASSGSGATSYSDVFYAQSAQNFVAGEVVADTAFSRPFIFAHTSVFAAILGFTSTVIIMIATVNSTIIPDVLFKVAAYVCMIYVLFVGISAVYLMVSNPVNVVVGKVKGTGTAVYHMYKQVDKTTLGSKFVNWIAAAGGIGATVLLVTEFDNKGENAAKDKRGSSFSKSLYSK